MSSTIRFRGWVKVRILVVDVFPLFVTVLLDTFLYRSAAVFPFKEAIKIRTGAM